MILGQSPATAAVLSLEKNIIPLDLSYTFVRNSLK
jgi:hypothetical protein